VSERHIDLPALTRALRELDHQQQRTDWIGDREVAWYYWRVDVERALSYADGELFPDYTNDELFVSTDTFFRDGEERK
jgi:hypothetical protein